MAVPALVGILVVFVWYAAAERRYIRAHIAKHGAFGTRADEVREWLASGELLPRTQVLDRLNAILNFQPDPQLERLRRTAVRRLIVLLFALPLALPLSMVGSALVVAAARWVASRGFAAEPLTVAIWVVWLLFLLLSRTRYALLSPRVSALGLATVSVLLVVWGVRG